MRSILKSTKLLLCALTMPFLLMTQQAYACTDDGGVIIIIVWFHDVPEMDGQQAIVTLGGMNTKLDPNGEACSAAMSFDPSVIASVDKLELLNSYTNHVVHELPFEHNAYTTDEIAGLSPSFSTEWAGFFGKPSKNFVAGDPVKMQFTVTLRDGVTEELFAKSLTQSSRFMRGSANFDGSMDFRHLTIHGGEKVKLYTH